MRALAPVEVVVEERQRRRRGARRVVERRNHHSDTPRSESTVDSEREREVR